MNLITVDIGNTSIKYFDHQKNIFISSIAQTFSGEIIFSTVLSQKDLDLKYPELQMGKWINSRIYLQKNYFLDMPIKYDTSTVGIDRILVCYEIFHQKNDHDQSSLVVDAGSFTTFDLVTHEGFSHGQIALGIQNFLNAYSSGSQLPLYSKKDFTSIKNINIALNTKEAILTAIFNSYKGIKKSFTAASQIILTGGDGEFLQQYLFKEAAYIDNLIHLALKRVYKNHSR